jgi:hypothetical protein
MKNLVKVVAIVVWRAVPLLVLSSLVEAVKVLVPAYANPATDLTQMWNTLISTANDGKIVVQIILNPASGPGAGSTIDPNYINAAGTGGAFYDFIKAGGVAYGYVPTNYANRLASEVQADIDKYYAPSYYRNAFGSTKIPLQGIFLDETSNDLANVPYYQTLYEYVKVKNPKAKVISNPGVSAVTGTSSTFTLDDYVKTADTMVIFENTGQEYLTNFQAPSWVDLYSTSRFAHLIHTQTTLPEDLVERAACTEHAGMVYVTQDVMPNPFDEIPTYWQDLVQDIIDATALCGPQEKGCFSASNTVQVRGKEGLVSMDSIQIGDYVLSRNHKTNQVEYSQVYSFSHYDPDLLMEYLQIFYTMADSSNDQPLPLPPSPLEVSPDHLLYKYDLVSATPTIVRASQIQVGDTLVGGGAWNHSDAARGVAVVSQIRYIQRRGAYAPVTSNGNLIVNHVTASSYVALLAEETMPSWMQHQAAHMAMSWVRWICHYSWNRYGPPQETYKEGISTWIWPMVQWVTRLDSEYQRWLQQLCAVVVVVPTLVLSYLLEPKEPVMVLWIVMLSILGVLWCRYHHHHFASLLGK